MTLRLPDVDSNEECSGATHWLQIYRMKLAKPLKRSPELRYSLKGLLNRPHNLKRLGFGFSSKLAKCFNSDKGLTQYLALLL